MIKMYSEEIKNLLELKNYYIEVKEYLKIINSPQVDHIKYENQSFNVWTKDGYYFKFKLKR